MSGSPIAAPCPDPGQPVHGARFGSNFAHNSTVKFQCRVGYKLIGQKTLKCFDGNWSSSIPECEGKTTGRQFELFAGFVKYFMLYSTFLFLVRR